MTNIVSVERKIVLPKFLTIHNRTEQEDPLKDCFHRIEIDGFVRAGFMEATAPKATMDATEYREGNMPGTVRKSPSGIAKFDNVTLKRGVIIAAGQGVDDVLDWFNQVYNASQGKAGSKNFRRTVDYVLLDREYVEARRFRMRECWPTEVIPMGDLKSVQGGDHIESMTLVHEGVSKVLS